MPLNVTDVEGVLIR